MAVAERRFDLKLSKRHQYLARMNELWGAYCKDNGENWPRFNGTALYTLAM